MLNAFWSGVAGALATQWVKRVFVPSFGFWAGGFLCLVWRYGWSTFVRWWEGLDAGQTIMVITAGLILVVVSGMVVQRFDTAMLRLLEGYWPNWWGVRHLRAKLTARLNESLEKDKNLSVELLAKGLDALSAEELEQFIRADARLRNAPPKKRQRMPTRLGNALRAAERRPRDRYGLEPIYVWPRLWLLLPEQAREDVANARESLNSNVRLALWGLLFMSWSVVAWWAFILGLGVAIMAYHWALDRAKTYGDLLEASFDLYRFDLYRALHWPLPANSATEKSHGEHLTQYLYRGYASDPIFFEPRAGDKRRAF